MSTISSSASSSSHDKPAPTPAFTDTYSSNLSDEKKEEKYVHEVYEAIAPHFSQTRYKPWPVVENFLKELEMGSMGADIGCGNGKYFGVNKNTFMIGTDRSSKLIEICKSRGFECLIDDALNLPFRNECFDFVISIAVIHHLTTSERRVKAIKELFRITKPNSKILIYVWALEQQSTPKKNANGTEASGGGGGEPRRNFDQNYQDVFVPWVIPKDKNYEDRKQNVVFKRYYHLFKKGELDELVINTNLAKILKSGYDKDNWYVIAEKI
nr:14414_t:CDS:2 [Entrophospora candida]